MHAAAAQCIGVIAYIEKGSLHIFFCKSFSKMLSVFMYGMNVMCEIGCGKQ